MVLDPNRSHDLDDVLDRINADAKQGNSTRFPSWNDVCRVRAYVGDVAWLKARAGRDNDYDLAYMILLHLSNVREGSTIATYTTIACSAHDAPIGSPCARVVLGIMREEEDLALPGKPAVCAYRVLAKHDRLAALELFEQPRVTPTPQDTPASSPYQARRQVIPISGDVLIAVSKRNWIVSRGLTMADANARAQYRHPKPFGAERIFVAGADDWTISDIRVGGESIIAPHRDLPGSLFSGNVMGPHLRLPTIEQDQWIEIASVRIRGDAPTFYASVIGTHTEASPA
jgi:hypothetical protein